MFDPIEQSIREHLAEEDRAEAYQSELDILVDTLLAGAYDPKTDANIREAMSEAEWTSKDLAVIYAMFGEKIVKYWEDAAVSRAEQDMDDERENYRED